MYIRTSDGNMIDDYVTRSAKFVGRATMYLTNHGVTRCNKWRTRSLVSQSLSRVSLGQNCSASRDRILLGFFLGVKLLYELICPSLSLSVSRFLVSAKNKTVLLAGTEYCWVLFRSEAPL